SDEHPPNNIQGGQKTVAARVNELLGSQSWKNSVLFITYDEGGGYYDHVSPPEACEPDDMLPDSGDGLRFDRLGFRVPFVAISPYVKRHHVSHETYDHSSILAFIEKKWNLPSITRRSANANPLSDLFDFDHPRFDVPALPKPGWSSEQAWKC